MISLAMLVKDPPLDRLAVLLEYVRPVVGQVVITVDDRTSEAASEAMRGLGAELVPFRWCDDFSAARNAALPYCRGDWILILDPDELPSAAMLDHVRSIDAGDSDAQGYIYWTVNFWAGIRGPELEEHWHVRLFRRGGHFYRPVHELVELDGRPESQTRGTAICPKAPREAYLIHSKPAEAIGRDDAVYARLTVAL